MSVVQGAGVGGGSLVYANISIDAKDGASTKGWPPEITSAELAPYYEAWARCSTLRAGAAGSSGPSGRELLRGSARRRRYGPTGSSRSISPSLRSTTGATRSPTRTTWSHAKNTPTPTASSREPAFTWATATSAATSTREEHARPQLPEGRRGERRRDPAATHRAPGRRPSRAGRAIESRSTHRRTAPLKPGSATARIVVLAAGSLGSTELLLRSRDVARRCRTSAPSSAAIGAATATSSRRRCIRCDDPPVDPTRGPTITAAIDLLDGEFDGNDSSSRTAACRTSPGVCSIGWRVTPAERRSEKRSGERRACWLRLRAAAPSGHAVVRAGARRRRRRLLTRGTEAASSTGRSMHRTDDEAVVAPTSSWRARPPACRSSH